MGLFSNSAWASRNQTLIIFDFVALPKTHYFSKWPLFFEKGREYSTLLAPKVEILSKVENTQPYSKYDGKIIGHLKKWCVQSRDPQDNRLGSICPPISIGSQLWEVGQADATKSIISLLGNATRSKMKNNTGQYTTEANGQVVKCSMVGRPSSVLLDQHSTSLLDERSTTCSLALVV